MLIFFSTYITVLLLRLTEDNGKDDCRIKKKRKTENESMNVNGILDVNELSWLLMHLSRQNYKKKTRVEVVSEQRFRFFCNLCC